MENMAFAGIDELAGALRRGEVSAVELAEAALQRPGDGGSARRR